MRVLVEPLVGRGIRVAVPARRGDDTLNLQLVGIAKQMHQRLRIIRFKIWLSDVSQDHHTRFQLCLRSHIANRIEKV